MKKVLLNPEDGQIGLGILMGVVSDIWEDKVYGEHYITYLFDGGSLYWGIQISEEDPIILIRDEIVQKRLKDGTLEVVGELL